MEVSVKDEKRKEKLFQIVDFTSKHSVWLGICQPTNGDLLKLLLHVGQRLSQAARWLVEGRD